MTMSEFRKFNAEQDRYFFSENTMRSFNSIIETGFIKGCYFVTSEKCPGGRHPRLYTVREANFETANVSKASEFQEFSELDDAVNYIIEEL